MYFGSAQFCAGFNKFSSVYLHLNALVVESGQDGPGLVFPFITQEISSFIHLCYPTHNKKTQNHCS